MTGEVTPCFQARCNSVSHVDSGQCRSSASLEWLHHRGPQQCTCGAKQVYERHLSCVAQNHPATKCATACQVTPLPNVCPKNLRYYLRCSSRCRTFGLSANETTLGFARTREAWTGALAHPWKGFRRSVFFQYRWNCGDHCTWMGSKKIAPACLRDPLTAALHPHLARVWCRCSCCLRQARFHHKTNFLICFN